MPLLTPSFKQTTFASSLTISVDLTGATGLIVQVYSQGTLTPGGTPILSAVIDPAGVNQAMVGLTEVASPVGGGKFRSFTYLGSLPTGVKDIVVTLADGNGKPNVWVQPISGFTAIGTLASATGGGTNATASVSSAIGSTVLSFLCISAAPTTITPSGTTVLNTRILSSDGGGSLSLFGAILSNPGAASVAVGAVASSTYGSWALLSWDLTPEAPPALSIDTQPTAQTVSKPAAATFSAVASGGTAPISYQWQRSAGGVGVWTSIAGANSASYTTPATVYQGGAANNGDMYRVVVSDAAAGSINSDEVALTVNAAPLFTAHPVSQTAAVGSTPTLGATSNGTTPITYQWQRSTNSGGSWGDVVGAVSASYTLPAATVSGGSANNGDQFRRVDTNGIGSTNSNAATLTVTASMVFTGPVADQSCVVGVPFSLDLSSYFSGGTPTYSYAVNTGTLPAGLTLNASTGVISGTPTTAGSASVVVRATDSAGSPTTADTNSIAFTVAATGLLTSSPLKNNTGTVLAVASCEAFVSAVSTGVLAVKKTGLTTNGSGVVSFTDPALAPGATYRVVWRMTADGAEGLETITAT